MPTQYSAYLAANLLDKEQDSHGLGQVIVLRRKSAMKVEAGVFLVDADCLGVRDAILFDGTEDEVQERITESPEPLREVPAPYARKFVEESIAYAKRLGFAPHRDYKKAARVFGGLKADPELGDFEFGIDGKPFYVQPSNHSNEDARRIIAKLERVCGEGNFNYMLKIDEDEYGADIEERILLSEGWLNHADMPAPGDTPTEAARQAYADFLDQTDVLDEALASRCYWEDRDGSSTIECLINVANAMESVLDREEKPCGLEEKKIFVHVLMTLMHLVEMDEDEAEDTLRDYEQDDKLPHDMTQAMRELIKDERMFEIMDTLVHPEPDVTLVPLSLEYVDREAGHYLFVVIEQRA
jgi:hypothetical protein